MHQRNVHCARIISCIVRVLNSVKGQKVKIRTKTRETSLSTVKRGRGLLVASNMVLMVEVVMIRGGI